MDKIVKSDWESKQSKQNVNFTITTNDDNFCNWLEVEKVQKRIKKKKKENRRPVNSMKTSPFDTKRKKKVLYCKTTKAKRMCRLEV